MKRLVFCLLVVIMALPMMAQKDAAASKSHDRTIVLIETSLGNVKIELYNETPKHRDNFLKLVKQGFYTGVLFHRVIPEFMVQTGDPSSRNAAPGQLLGGGSLNYTIPSEVVFPKYYHKRGAIAAAQSSDAVDNESSPCQFYIVTGKIYGPRMLDMELNKLTEKSGGKLQFTEQIKNDYKTIGGVPHLDGTYTVFGEVIEGMDVVDQIQNVEKDGNDRPLKDIKIIKASVVAAE